MTKTMIWAMLQHALLLATANGQTAPNTVGPTSALPVAVRVGQVEVTVASVQTLPPRIRASLWIGENSGKHYVLFGVNIKNVDRHPNCTYFTPVLKVTLGLKAKPVEVSTLPTPKTFHLWPGKEVQGGYGFIVEDGLEPVELILQPQPRSSVHCRLDFDPPLPPVALHAARIRLGKLPGRTNQ